ncbi:RluA family pseudouridine synthase [Cardinium endosymbiont of Oedothorax gibbosus]|uniref:RluA family pseudouridine synthase n=1 Tax=Cardinium endosymbiont of Oedothorax gibbosus TaxID=931101 RepID=UPI002023BE6D|nr:RluA family pseudouridine synthase [Cardinium endosymbiont of Oedothorax gibbosus]CAH2559696.1 Ribosomal large subunit pseudouridine synthase D [Cardinium endosymbiont of Oedothorax gibbosus]
MKDYPLPETLFTEYVVTVTKEQSNLRIDKFLSDILQISRNKIQEAIANRSISVNRHFIKSNYMVQPEDEIVAHIPKPIDAATLTPETIPLDIVYEDDHLLVVYKPAQMVVHPDTAHRTGTLAHGLLYRYKHLPLKDNMPTRPGLVHRIDKNTSGLLVVAKTAESLVALTRQFYNHTVTRTYYTLVWSNPQNEIGTIDINIGKDSHNHQKISAFPDNQQGKRAVTHYQVIKRLHHVALVACRLETGRTHQIRVHMQHIGHPVFGDPQYGGDVIASGERYASYKAFVHNCFKLMPYQALHAAVLGFKHPVTEAAISFEAPLPENFIKLIEKWEKYVTSSSHHVA